MADPDFYRTAGEQVATTTIRLETIETELNETYARWEELDSLSN
jgi:ATP-binding cassette subfamily F protein uup